MEVEDTFKCLCLPSYEGDRCEIGMRLLPLILLTVSKTTSRCHCGGFSETVRVYLCEWWGTLMVFGGICGVIPVAVVQIPFNVACYIKCYCACVFWNDYRR